MLYSLWKLEKAIQRCIYVLSKSFSRKLVFYMHTWLALSHNFNPNLISRIEWKFFKRQYIWVWKSINLFQRLRAQSFTSLTADIRQDINRGFTFSRCLNGTFPWRKCSVKALVSFNSEEYQCFNRAIPWRKCSIKPPANWRNSVYVLTEICHQRSKWLDP